VPTAPKPLFPWNKVTAAEIIASKEDCPEDEIDEDDWHDEDENTELEDQSSNDAEDNGGGHNIDATPISANESVFGDIQDDAEVIIDQPNDKRAAIEGTGQNMDMPHETEALVAAEVENNIDTPADIDQPNTGESVEAKDVLQLPQNALERAFIPPANADADENHDSLPGLLLATAKPLMSRPAFYFTIVEEDEENKPANKESCEVEELQSQASSCDSETSTRLTSSDEATDAEDRHYHEIEVIGGQQCETSKEVFTVSNQETALENDREEGEPVNLTDDTADRPTVVIPPPSRAAGSQELDIEEPTKPEDASVQDTESQYEEPMDDPLTSYIPLIAHFDLNFDFSSTDESARTISRDAIKLELQVDNSGTWVDDILYRALGVSPVPQLAELPKFDDMSFGNVFDVVQAPRDKIEAFTALDTPPIIAAFGEPFQDVPHVLASLTKHPWMSRRRSSTASTSGLPCTTSRLSYTSLSMTTRPWTS